ncbi:rifin [Plasmodium falciparum IGH-CR14]|uniref:Rifin n=1 Tax=Plasmodium falciparum IGH-CR14 TaxID=580059 RepID=A0A0L1I3Q7_PLAFA|nr:rifin [Plasmodium falciparum IGH-CR14]
MKVHYINILLFAIPLNILVNAHKKKPSITPNHPSNTRLLCDCELYAPANYDNDPQMKEVMEIFDRQTSERFHEYDERMKTTRQKCKDKCDEAIQKIILKDKLEKELMDKFATLHTDIQSDAIPTCVCEKSIADKVEKFCLNCGMNVGGAVTLSSGVLGGIGAVAVHAWKPLALKAAIAAALNAAASNISATAKAAGIEVGKGVVIAKLKALSVHELIPEISEKISSIDHYANITKFVDFIYSQYSGTCIWFGSGFKPTACNTFEIKLSIKTADPGTHGYPPKLAIRELLNGLAEDATQAADYVTETTTKEATAAAIETSKKAIDAASTHLNTTNTMNSKNSQHITKYNNYT